MHTGDSSTQALHAVSVMWASVVLFMYLVKFTESVHQKYTNKAVVSKFIVSQARPHQQ